MKWKNYNKENCLYFVTITIRKFIQLFLDDNIVKIIFSTLDFLRKNKGLRVYAYVIMPEHIHLIVGLVQYENSLQHQQKITVLMGDFKRFSSREIARYLQVEKPLLFEKFKVFAYRGQNYAVWQETFRSEVIYKKEFLRQKADYIHMNPVRRGLVENPGDWKNSSFGQIWKDDDVLGEPVFIVDKLVSV